jgi:NADH:ubiquinone oxidoreductase subunit 6 (subunit J)
MLAIAMAIELVWALQTLRPSAVGPGGERETAWTVSEIGQRLFTDYAFAFEATSVMILVAMIGAMALAGRFLTGTKP